MKKNILPFLAAAALLAACSALVDTHGTIIPQSQLDEIKPGVTTKDQVRQILGSPATEGTLNERRWLYITNVTENKPLQPNMLKHQTVVVVDFDPSGTVTGITQKTEADAKTVDPADKITPTHGQSLGIIDQMFKNIGVDKD